MANVLTIEKQATVIGALAEGNSIRSIERMTGIHRDTIMRLGVRVGEGCQRYMSENLRDLTCRKIQVDEIWGYVGKHQRFMRPTDNPNKIGDAWTFVAIDAETKLVPSFLVGKRDLYTASAFMQDLASRLSTRIQLSSDSLNAYAEAIERGFGNEVDYGVIVKTFTMSDLNPGRYSPPDILHVTKSARVGNPLRRDISTSYVERQNLTMRMHMRRLTRLTNAFSKKIENFRAAVALHFAYYNYVKTHGALKCSPAMAAGVQNSFLTVENLVEMSQ